jgi:tetratricopeptide (TPR) repeat protein
MNVQINQLVKSLLQKDSIDQCSIQELKQYAEQHPYFGAAQLLLAKKMKDENAEQYNDQLQKTYLFFHNPLWVEALLNETGTAKITHAKLPIFTPFNDAKEESAFNQTINISEVPVLEPIETLFSDSILSKEEKTETIIKEEVNIPASPLSDIAKETQASNSIIPSEEKVENILVAPEVMTKPLALTEQIPEEQTFNLSPLKMEVIDPAKAPLTFEPFYTVDYFASQGIKFKEEDKPIDKFGQHLKSFTDWLKVMKRLPLSEITKTVNANAEQKVEQLAEHSLESREVLTEAMAEVWEKQGNMEKAIEIYNKLSLLDPPKSAYFAAKIEDLKKTN